MFQKLLEYKYEVPVVYTQRGVPPASTSTAVAEARRVNKQIDQSSIGRFVYGQPRNCDESTN